MYIKDKVANHHSILYWWLKQIGFHILLGILLFLSAQTFKWLSAWYYIVLSASLTLIQSKAMDLNLMRERSKFQTTTPKWDKWLYLLIYFVGPILIYIIAGMEHRISFEFAIQKELQITAFIFLIVSGGLMTWILSVNDYYACAMRIQYEREHKLITTGPYGLVRHPGYFCSILTTIATPIALGSLFALIISMGIIICLIFRTYLEDLILTRHFKGYYDYTKQVRYRLFPGIW